MKRSADEHELQMRRDAIEASFPPIEKGVPIPKRRNGKSKTPTAVFIESMEIGDSVVFDKEKRAHDFKDAIQRNGFESVVFKTREGYRVWKVKRFWS